MPRLFCLHQMETRHVRMQATHLHHVMYFVSER